MSSSDSLKEKLSSQKKKIADSKTNSVIRTRFDKLSSQKFSSTGSLYGKSVLIKDNIIPYFNGFPILTPLKYIPAVLIHYVNVCFIVLIKDKIILNFNSVKIYTCGSNTLVKCMFYSSNKRQDL